MCLYACVCMCVCHQHVVFGRVTAGMDVVKAIEKVGSGKGVCIDVLVYHMYMYAYIQDIVVYFMYVYTYIHVVKAIENESFGKSVCMNTVV